MAATGALEPDSNRSFVEINWYPPAKTLREFGIAAGCLLPLLGWLFLGRGNPFHWPAVSQNIESCLIGIGLLAAGFGLVSPQLLRWPFVVLCLLAFPIGLVVGFLLLAGVYFLVFTPVALVFRLQKRDALALEIEPEKDTYWQPRKIRTDAASYFRQS